MSDEAWFRIFHYGEEYAYQVDGVDGEVAEITQAFFEEAQDDEQWEMVEVNEFPGRAGQQ